MKIMSAEPKPENFATLASPQAAAIAPARPLKGAVSAYARAPEFFGNRFVYAVISQRAHGLSIGVNMNPDKACNFDCAYCEVNRDLPSRDSSVNLQILASELETLLGLARGGSLRQFPYFQNVPEELLALKSVTLSGEGEPTLSPQF